MKRLAIDQKIRLYRPRWFRKEYRRKVGAICSKMHITDFLTYFLRCFGRKKIHRVRFVIGFGASMTSVNTYELHFETFYGFRLWKKKYDMGGGPLTLGLPPASPAQGRMGQPRVKECCLMYQESFWNIKTYIPSVLKKSIFQRKTLFVQNRPPVGNLARFLTSRILRWKNRFLQNRRNVGFYVSEWFLVHQTTLFDPWLAHSTLCRPCPEI